MNDADTVLFWKDKLVNSIKENDFFNRIPPKQALDFFVRYYYGKFLKGGMIKFKREYQEQVRDTIHHGKVTDAQIAFKKEFKRKIFKNIELF